MKNGYTHIAIVLDRSGSMQSIARDTIGGFNTFLKDQQEAPGEATITLAQFDNEYETVYAGRAIKEAPPLDSKTFVPRGGTALNDAIGRTINLTGAWLAAKDEAQRPEKVIFVILTDGGENASREFTGETVKAMVKEQTEKYQWQFVFIGANQDAVLTGAGLGFSAANSMTYAANAVGTQAAYASLSANTRILRSGVAKSMSFSKEDLEAQAKAGA